MITLLSALAAFCVFILVLAAVFRIVEVKRRVRAIGLTALAVAPVYFWIYSSLMSESGGEALGVPEGLFHFSIVIIFLWFGYLQFYFLVERGVSARILQHLLELNRESNIENIKKLYPFDDVLRRRVDDMVYGGYLSQEQASGQTLYRNTPKGTIAGMITTFVKKFFRLGEGG